MKLDCLKRYGVEHYMQNTEIFYKAQKSGFTLKKYTFPSGRIELVQGYEPFAWNYILNVENINEDDIVVNCRTLPEIWYDHPADSKRHRYYPDGYITSTNTFIEVKSEYTYNRDLGINDAKCRGVIEMGVGISVYVMKADGELYFKSEYKAEEKDFKIIYPNPAKIVIEE